MRELPFSQACENNKRPILDVLKSVCTEAGDLLEIGHGTGQHAVFLSQNLPHLNWTPADVAENNWMIIEQQKNHSTLNNPLTLKINEKESMHSQLANKSFDYVFSANTLHIMSEKNALRFCEEVAKVCNTKAKLLLYGPFKFNGEFTSDSNSRFDAHLRQQNPLMGIRDYEKLAQYLSTNFEFIERYDLPANNQILCFHKND
tara:strand:- start:42068 stop:42673 length:606 start_codon:yes stop_codon:yes gene_type:complete